MSLNKDIYFKFWRQSVSEGCTSNSLLRLLPLPHQCPSCLLSVSTKYLPPVGTCSMVFCLSKGIGHIGFKSSNWPYFNLNGPFKDPVSKLNHIKRYGQWLRKEDPSCIRGALFIMSSLINWYDFLLRLLICQSGLIDWLIDWLIFK